MKTRIIQHRYFISFIFIMCHSFALAQTEEQLMAKADSLEALEDWNGAIKLYTNLIETYGEQEKLLRARGFSYIEMGDMNKGKADYTKALALNPECANCYVHLAIIAKQHGNLETYKNYLDKALRMDKENVMAYSQRGEFRMSLGDYAGAISDYSALTELAPTNPLAYLMRSMCYSATGNVEKAFNDINKTIQIEPDVEYAYYVRAKLYIQLGQYQLAIDDLNLCLSKNQKFGEYYTYRAFAYQSYGKPDSALLDYAMAIKLNPADHNNYLNRSYIHSDMLKFDLACADKKKAIELMPLEELEMRQTIAHGVKYECDDRKPTYHYAHIEHALSGRHLEEAKKMVDKAAKKYKNSPVLCDYKGRILMMQGAFSDALVQFENALKYAKQLPKEQDLSEQQYLSSSEFASSFEASILESMSFANVNMLDFQKALDNLNEALVVLGKVSSTPFIVDITSETYGKKSSILLSLMRFTEAKECLLSGISFNPQNAGLHTQMANLLILEATHIFDNINQEQIGVTQGKNNFYTTAQIDKAKVDKLLLEKALLECNIALAIDRYASDAYFHRAQAKYLLNQPDYCQDLELAYSLGLTYVYERMGVKCE